MDDLMIELKGKVASKLQDARKIPFAQISGLKKVWRQLTLAYLHTSFQGETIKGILLPAATITAHYTLPHTAEWNEDLLHEVITEWEIPEKQDQRNPYWQRK